MIDQNRDGVIDIEDLKDIYSNLGRIPPDEELKEMLKEAPGPLNFTMFLNLFGEKLSDQADVEGGPTGEGQVQLQRVCLHTQGQARRRTGRLTRSSLYPQTPSVLLLLPESLPHTLTAGHTLAGGATPSADDDSPGLAHLLAKTIATMLVMTKDFTDVLLNDTKMTISTVKDEKRSR
ncbi:hypothetical protein C0Q70_08863 [Pomacea canaliculata]|uniref:EF-hand domain-containing protein n=1 Tax=Pomacea canaliculata TaxID=400727 RepID=A0A2T7P866_POMCA|nr:hypothetical protein C0Q70_08863 [Pomacea canaliculata]